MREIQTSSSRIRISPNVEQIRASLQPLKSWRRKSSNGDKLALVRSMFVEIRVREVDAQIYRVRPENSLKFHSAPKFALKSWGNSGRVRAYVLSPQHPNHNIPMYY